MARYRLRLLLQEFDVPPGETVLGRSPDCHITLDDPLVSREHAKIVNDGEKVVFHDLGSRNGSKVNGEALRGSTDLKDGDRLRIGNQELVFTHAPVAKRQARPTGSLRHCRQCQTPYASEAPSCPHCGYTPGAEDTLSGSIPTATPVHSPLDRDNWGVALQLELLDKALSLYRIADADRVITGLARAIDERLGANASLEGMQFDEVLTGAVKLSSLRGDGRWLGWAFAILERAEKMPGSALLAQLGQVPPIVLDEAGKQLESLVRFWNERSESVQGAAMHALGTLASLRDEVRARAGRDGKRGDDVGAEGGGPRGRAPRT